jgi:cobalt-zinc-cadmium efflux system outer membrane protein
MPRHPLLSRVSFFTGRVAGPLVLVLLLPLRAAAAEDTAVPSPADTVVAGLGDPGLRSLVREVLDRNPDLAAARARARAASERPQQAGSLPDPMAGLTAYLQSPETRVGPQLLLITLSQKLPWFGKLGLKEKAAQLSAAALGEQVEAKRLSLVTETRSVFYELGFLAAWEGTVRADRSTLVRYEKLARTRYASGVGLEQVVIKIQAEITRDDSRLLEIGNRRASLLARLNALRDVPPGTAVPEARLPEDHGVSPDFDELRRRAMQARPEMGQANAAIAEADALSGLARKEYGPDMTLGLTYGLVEKRDDAPGIVAPPPDNGKDIIGLNLAFNLPVWSKRLSGGVREASERRLAAEDSKRAVIAEIDRTLGELKERLPLTWEQLRLLDDVLLVQAEQSLRSAEAGYAAGSLNALDLLDAERVLLEIRTASARALADYGIAVARLEGAVGSPLSGSGTMKRETP